MFCHVSAQRLTSAKDNPCDIKMETEFKIEFDVDGDSPEMLPSPGPHADVVRDSSDVFPSPRPHTDCELER